MIPPTFTEQRNPAAAVRPFHVCPLGCNVVTDRPQIKPSVIQRNSRVVVVVYLSLPRSLLLN